MIYGIGCDIIEIERIAKADKLFLEKHFTTNEQKLFEKKKHPQTIAANFATKEAFSKALGTGVRGFSLNEVEVLRDDMGKPYINLYGNAEKICKDVGVGEIFITISHSKELAMAYVVLEKE